jgi:hypothetical protein
VTAYRSDPHTIIALRGSRRTEGLMHLCWNGCHCVRNVHVSLSPMLLLRTNSLPNGDQRAYEIFLD